MRQKKDAKSSPLRSRCPKIYILDNVLFLAMRMSKHLFQFMSDAFISRAFFFVFLFISISTVSSYFSCLEKTNQKKKKFCWCMHECYSKIFLLTMSKLSDENSTRYRQSTTCWIEMQQQQQKWEKWIYISHESTSWCKRRRNEPMFLKLHSQPNTSEKK